MVPPAVVKPVALGGLPPARLYWELPDESGVPSALSGQQVGQLPQPPAPPGSAQP